MNLPAAGRAPVHVSFCSMNFHFPPLCSFAEPPVSVRDLSPFDSCAAFLHSVWLHSSSSSCPCSCLSFFLYFVLRIIFLLFACLFRPAFLSLTDRPGLLLHAVTQFVRRPKTSIPFAFAFRLGYPVLSRPLSTSFSRSAASFRLSIGRNKCQAKQR